MKIFILEDDPEVFAYIEQLKVTYEVFHVRNLKDAAYLLEYEPGVKSFNKFIFDAALISEVVIHRNKGTVQYKENNNFNGLLFLLNNLDILGKKAYHSECIAIITALTNKLRDIPSFIMPDKARIISKSELTYEEKRILQKNQRAPKIRFNESGREYMFSYIDKTASDILIQIDKFITNG
jgi:hypothetical protein